MALSGNVDDAVAVAAVDNAAVARSIGNVCSPCTQSRSHQTGPESSGSARAAPRAHPQVREGRGRFVRHRFMPRSLCHGFRVESRKRQRHNLSNRPPQALFLAIRPRRTALLNVQRDHRAPVCSASVWACAAATTDQHQRDLVQPRLPPLRLLVHVSYSLKRCCSGRPCPCSSLTLQSGLLWQKSCCLVQQDACHRETPDSWAAGRESRCEERTCLLCENHFMIWERFSIVRQKMGTSRSIR